MSIGAEGVVVAIAHRRLVSSRNPVDFGVKANHLLYRVAALSLALTLVLDYAFMRWWGVVGIALAGFAIRLVSSLYLSCKISLVARRNRWLSAARCK